MDPASKVPGHEFTGAHVAVGANLVPFASMPDVPDRHSKLLGPKEGNRGERPFKAEHVGGCDLPLPLRQHPVFDPHSLPTDRVRIFGYIAGSEDPWLTAFEMPINANASRSQNPRGPGELNTRPHAHSDDDEVSLEAASINKRDCTSVERGSGRVKMKTHAVALVQALKPFSHFFTEQAGERHALERDNGYVYPSLP
jgi:hypothetical protein